MDPVHGWGPCFVPSLCLYPSNLTVFISQFHDNDLKLVTI